MYDHERIKKVEEILWACEEGLSDGYEFYSGNPQDTVYDIAKAIVDAVCLPNKPVDRTAKPEA